MQGANRKHRCHEAQNYFKQCFAINAFMANDKKYYPHRYITSEYHHISPHHNSIDAEPRN